MADCFELDPSYNSEERELNGSLHGGPQTLSDKNLQGALQALDKREKEVSTLRCQLAEILRINHQWDSEYKELKKLYDNSLLKQIPFNNTCSTSTTCTNDLHVYESNSELIKEKKRFHEQLTFVKNEKEQIEGKFTELKSKYDNLKRQYTELLTSYNKHQHSTKTTPTQSPPTHSNSTGSIVKSLQEEKMLLTSQVQAYKEDYNAEKRDREKVIRERETERLRYEAEIASLKIQLDRSTSELVRYKGEAAILGQQLRLKQQREDEEYRRHLENQGYSSRKPLPPLDPFVEKDVHTLYYSHSDPVMTPPLLSPTTSYKTHINETRPHREIVRRTSIPLIRPCTIDLVTPPKRGEQEDVSLRSVSPQIHRLGNYRLYSRESDPDFETSSTSNPAYTTSNPTHTTSNPIHTTINPAPTINYSDINATNNKDIQRDRRIQLDLQQTTSYKQYSLSSDNSPLEWRDDNLGTKCVGGANGCVSMSTPDLTTH